MKNWGVQRRLLLSTEREIFLILSLYVCSVMGGNKELIQNPTFGIFEPPYCIALTCYLILSLGSRVGVRVVGKSDFKENSKSDLDLVLGFVKMPIEVKYCQASPKLILL